MASVGAMATEQSISDPDAIKGIFSLAREAAKKGGHPQAKYRARQGESFLCTVGPGPGEGYSVTLRTIMGFTTSNPTAREWEGDERGLLAYELSLILPSLLVRNVTELNTEITRQGSVMEKGSVDLVRARALIDKHGLGPGDRMATGDVLDCYQLAFSKIGTQKLHAL